MQDQRFDRAVRVALGAAGNTTYVVERVAQAADILLNRLPAKPGRKHMAARRACLDVLYGLKDASAARKAFAAAAEEANILSPDPITHSCVGRPTPRPRNS
ncbi:MAG: DUF982 domain-containing protein [Mesorhizobium sp.]|uniref:DUF982 domain-containing protein n=1 Tax=Mesorhizobium sp. TaxID=1871066 RepID=UPI000FE76102|nr:DUF982 domain-containing protein [Mesorhizobium sp.]RWM15153.1 MAG: DUF982 domain-containing protein [Mesorhizobium sp.]TIP75849.1 MAG: DUF982 domain-containing protein [Mesorhizobium sp.]TIQ12583.1 MAG: DUF982 domain-containing protein [Mesorhizobium sp.]TIR53640.1 MAG: DUF982 domain-containing protein [Mesorhizobium sp.]TJV95154.1 MAG: DUF982 domain-containing protein [Mesorhizobium sp.]